METVLKATLSLEGKKIGVVVSRWNELVTKELLDGALDTLKSYNPQEIIVAHVPGTWEIPILAQHLLPKVDGLVALGCILQGATHHAAQLSGDVSGALMRLQLDHKTPITWGILTPENQEQALERSGLKMGNKGREAASALVEMVSLLR